MSQFDQRSIKDAALQGANAEIPTVLNERGQTTKATGHSNQSTQNT